MTELLERAVAKLRTLPSEQQDDAARMLLQWTGEDQPTIQLSAAEEASFALSLDQAARGEFADEDAVRAVWAKQGL